MSENQATLFQRIVSATFGSLAVASLMTPLDVIKVRMQAQSPQYTMSSRATPANFAKCPNFQFCNGIMDHSSPKSCYSHFHSTIKIRNPLQMAIYTVRSEGVTALWSGLRPTLIMAIPANVLYFAAYEELNYQMRSTFLGSYSPLIAGSVARVVSATVVSPIELVRTQMQSANASNEGFVRRLINISNLPEGRVSLFRGLGATLLRDVPFSGLYWYLYERATQKLERSTSLQKPVISFWSGGIAGTTAAFVTTPFDVVKTRRQLSQYIEQTAEASTSSRVSSGSFSILREVYKQEGFRGMFAGVFPRCARIAPSCAIMITSYEVGKLYFNG